MSNPAYRNVVPAGLVIDRLRGACASRLHEFWPDDLSILDPALVDSTRLHGPGQLTDAYLLALAVAHRGRLVTFDTSVPRSAVLGAADRNLLVI
jgi:predicted nucleic acid-binding protein